MIFLTWGFVYFVNNLGLLQKSQDRKKTRKLKSSSFYDTIQLKMNFNTEIYVKDDVKLRLVKNIIERINLSQLRKVYSSFGRKPTVNPVTMILELDIC